MCSEEGWSEPAYLGSQDKRKDCIPHINGTLRYTGHELLMWPCIVEINLNKNLLGSRSCVGGWKQLEAWMP
jgi:hypothetical protein